jgi:hypothetical protein
MFTSEPALSFRAARKKLKTDSRLAGVHGKRKEISCASMQIVDFGQIDQRMNERGSNQAAHQQTQHHNNCGNHGASRF